MKRISKVGMTFLAAGMVCMGAQAQKSLPVEFSGVLCTEVNTSFDNGRWNNSSLLFLTAKAPLWKGATFTGELGGFHDIGMEKHGGWWSVMDDQQYFTNLPIKNVFTLSQFNITQQVTDNLSFRLGVFKAGEYFATPVSSLFLNTSIVTPPVLGDRWQLPHYHMSALGIHGQWEIIPGLTVKNSLFNGRASYEWRRAFNFRPGHDGIQNISQIVYKCTDEDSYVGEYRVGLMYADSHYKNNRWTDPATSPAPGAKKSKGTAWFANIDQPVLQGDYPVALTLGGYLSKEKSNFAYQYFNTGAVMKNILFDGSRLGVNLCRAFFTGGAHESDIEVTYAMPIFTNFEIQPGVHFIRTSGNDMTGALVRATLLF